MLVRNKIFWIMTPLFLIGALTIIWLVYPPLIRQLQANRTQLVALDATLQVQKEFVTLITTLAKQEKEVSSLFQAAEQALPVSVSGEILLLQLDGLLHSIGLDSATITAPFAAAVPAATPAPTDTSGVKPSSQSGANPTTTPIVKSNNQNGSTVTITVETNFTGLKTLLEKLRHLARWNKIGSLTIEVTTDKMKATISTQIFTKPDAAKEFTSSDAQFLTKATQLFSSFTSYTTVPDASKEGRYGRQDPFAPL